MIMHAEPNQLKNFFFFDPPPKSKVRQSGSAAIVPVQGVIGWADTWADLAANIEEAAGMPGDRIILDINSPGGYSEGIGEILSAIEYAKKRKQVIAFVPGVAASLAYWIASAAHRIVANESAIIGAIGTIVDVYKQDSEWRVTMVSSQTPLKVADPDKPETLVPVQEMLDDMTEIFIRNVAQGRGLDEKKVLDTFGKGAVLVAHKALAAGMIDAIGNFKSVLSTPATAKQEKTENRMAKKIHAKLKKGLRAELVVVDDETADVEGEPVETITKEWLEENMPELVEQIKEEGRQEERDRIGEIDEEAGDPMDAEEAQAIAAARKDGKVTAATFAATFFKTRAQKLAGQNKNHSLADREADAPAPIKPGATDGAGTKVTSLADRMKAAQAK
jgi:capsid assembly protease